jgi:23S rRNA (cytosine1962-C5)-methyltransferase
VYRLARRTQDGYNPRVIELRFRAPGERLVLASLLERAVPGASRDDARRWCAGGRVRSEGRPASDASGLVAPGALVELTLPAREIGARAAAGVRVRLEGPDWTLLERARASGPEELGIAAEPRGPGEERAVLGVGARGLELVAKSARAADRLAAALAGEGACLVYRALAPAPPWRSGALAIRAGASALTQFRVAGERDGLAELELATRGPASPFIRGELAALGSPVLGDALHGGRLVEGGLHLALVSLRLSSEGIDVAAETPLDWPASPAFPPEPEAPRDAPVLAVSRATRAALARGHPWVLTDAETGDVGRFRPGGLLRVEARGSAPGSWLRAETPGEVAARVWSRVEPVAGVRERVERALGRRAALLHGPAARETDVFRLVHGEADGFPALFVDRLGPLLRVLVTGRACDLVREEVVALLVERLRPLLGEEARVVEVIHLRGRPRGGLECARLARGALPEPLAGRLGVRERGLRFLVDPGLARPATPTPGVGLYADQRENRERLARLAGRGGRWLNLFAHTGAFSVALLAGGADEVTSVDADPAWLRWLEENLRANELSERAHRAVRSDARRFLERLAPGERFRGIVLDPPTASAGRRFWSARRDLEALVAACLTRLEAGGWLLACRNDRAGRGRLRGSVAAAARAADVELASLEPALPGPDFPRLAGFPEGDPFEAVLARRRP